MPKIFEQDGYRFFIYSNEHRPITHMFAMAAAKRCSMSRRPSSSVSHTA